MPLNGERMKDLRKSLGMAQQDLADRVGRRVQAIIKYENSKDGKNQPSVEVLLGLAKALETNMEYLCGETDYSKPLPPDVGALLTAADAGDAEGLLKIVHDRTRKVAEEIRRDRAAVRPKKK